MAVRFTGGSTDIISRTTGTLPSAIVVSACGYAKLSSLPSTYGTLFGIESAGGANYILVSVQGTDGVVHYYDLLPSDVNTGYTVAVGVPFFWAISKNDTALALYFRTIGSSTFTKATATVNAAVFTQAVVEFGSDSFSEVLTGDIDGVRVWADVALQPEEIAAEYGRLTPARTAGLWYASTLEGGGLADVLFDRSGRGSHFSSAGSVSIAPRAAIIDQPHALHMPNLRRRLWGAAASTANYTFTASGGIVFAGDATEISTANWVATTSGGLIFAGAASATSTAAYVVTGAGGLTFAGAASATAGAEYTFAGTGGLTLSGAAAITYTTAYAMTGAGGLAFAGAASALSTAQYVVTGAGGIAFSGTAAAQASSGYEVVGAGGLAFGGAATAFRDAYVITAAGGLVFSGAAATELFVPGAVGADAWRQFAARRHRR